jgi:glycosyltransferase involved in cell wall biosynthesis
MRIAYVIPAYPPVTSQPFVVNEMVEVQEAGHPLVVLGLHRGAGEPVRHGTFERLRPEHVLPPALCDWRTLGLAVWVTLTRPVRVLRTLAGLHWEAGRQPWAHARLIAVTPKALAAAWRFERLGVEHIHAHWATATAECAAIAGAVSGLPFSFTAHAYDIYSQAPRVRNATLAWKLRHAAQVFCVSNFLTELIRRQLPPERRDRVATTYVGIPTHLFRVEPPPPDTQGLRLLCVARFVETKGLDTLVAACGLLRDRGLAFRLDVFGDGPLRPALEAQIARLGLAEHVVLPGHISQEEVACRMRACHLFVMPCRQDRVGDMDGIPTVFMEAMATGRPVVSCALSGIPELVRDEETGLLVPPDDPGALADAIARLAANPEERLRLGRQGRALVERQHDQHPNAQRVVRLLLQTHASTDGSLRTSGSAR